MEDKSDIQKYVVDYVLMAKNGELPPVVARENEAIRLAFIMLRYYKPNPVLIGPAGVGKRSIVLFLAGMLAAQNPSLPKDILSKKIVGINQAQIIADIYF